MARREQGLDLNGWDNREGPVRTCVGCRRRDPQHLLVRVVRLSSSSPRLRVDVRRRLPGRGAWLHPEPQCLHRALSRRAFDRSFRAAVDATDVESWIAQHVPGTSPVPGTTVNLKAGQNTDGNPMSASR
ncbi:hypothetical protein GCM10011512_27530 [Tersicoccus solisilvae]|uniref:YlxR domain-containing protein n=1 Tax=Tersicoccus solisilvae TaxID=1882339 RepID=A0ABQ1PL96_9MICC|nr:YlxR family protein [Tersicoccus solisilvae]GGC99135.1 hypothetical protein GCM10011512_27530 [Tersicoccus solisilvae]